MGRGGIIVTGASRGIGAAIAEWLAEAGYTVGCLSRSGTPPQRPDAGPDIRVRWVSAAADVTDADDLRSAIATVAANAPIVGLVNNAGLHLEERSANVSLADWNAVIATNAASVMLASQSAYPHLVAAGGGLIVNIGSFFDKLGVKRNLAYCASKAAVGAMTRVLAVEWASKGISVLDVAPGYIVTDLNRDAISQGPLRAYLDKRIPAGRPGDADDVARLIASLFAARSPFLTGETIYIDGAQGVAH